MEHEDPEMQRLWDLVNELSEQLSQNRALTASLQSQVGLLKSQAAHTGSGTSLRRFNLDISKEVFETDLERTNAQVILEHQQLTQENKQLSALLKEFEQTLDTVMAKFRGHAVAAQQHEQTMIRHYETLLASRPELDGGVSFAHNPAHLDQLAHHLRLALRALQGSDAGPDPAFSNELSAFDSDSEHPASSDPSLEDPAAGPADWAVERELEIARLEQENADLRRVLGIDGPISPEEARDMGLGMGLSISSMDTGLRSPSSQSSHFGPGSGSGIIIGAGGGGSISAGSFQQPQSWRPQAPPAPQQQRRPNLLPGAGGAPMGRGMGIGLAPAPQIGGGGGSAPKNPGWNNTPPFRLV